MVSRFVALRSRSPLAAWWRGKSGGERRVIGVLGIVVAIVVLWVALWEPLQRDMRRLRMEKQETQAALAQARVAVDEITRLARTPSPAPTDVRAAIEASLVRSGLRSALTDVQWQSGRAQLTFGAVPFPALTQWLEALHRDAGIVVQQATLSARVDQGSVRADITVGR